MSPESPTPPPGESRGNGRFGSDQGWPRWTILVLVAVVVGAIMLQFLASSTKGNELSYGDFISKLQSNDIKGADVSQADATFDNTNGHISGTLSDGSSFTTTGPLQPPDADQQLMTEKGVDFSTPTDSLLGTLLPLLLPVALLIGFFVWMQRRAQGQMGSIMSIGRSKAKTYSTEKPATTFADVAGYAGVKQDVTEVVDFLKHPEKFGEIGARIPKGVLLVGPPGTGKTLIARAVAGEAGVPFLSVTGSDFMEMFVGVGASRVRDLFQSARKMGRAIIFVDEIDSIGRKRGAGLGGGHDEREQTLNQMLAEMDGFEVTTGIVMIAATNRPDILDPALLRPGRFDRQVVVPLPELDDRPPDPRGPRQAQAHGPRRRPRPGRPGHARHERRRPLEPGQRGRPVRRARRQLRGAQAPLRGRPRPRAHGPAPRVHGALRPREGGHRLPRGRPRGVRRGAPHRRPAAQGHDHPVGHGPRRHHAAARSRSATSTARTTSRTPSSSAWAGASPRSSSSAWSPPAPTTTSSAPPSWPARWCANGA